MKPYLKVIINKIKLTETTNNNTILFANLYKSY